MANVTSLLASELCSSHEKAAHMPKGAFVACLVATHAESPIVGDAATRGTCARALRLPSIIRQLPLEKKASLFAKRFYLFILGL